MQREIKAPNGFPISNVIQTDASINPGNSGGPLLDANGRVIGINSQIATGGGSGSVGIGFAIPINTAKQLLPQLEQGGEIERAYLGVAMAPVTKRARQRPQPAGRARAPCVQRGRRGGPADKAGLRGGAHQRPRRARGGRRPDREVGRQDGQARPTTCRAAIADNEAGRRRSRSSYYRGNDKQDRQGQARQAARPSSSTPSGGSAAASPDPGRGRRARPRPRPTIGAVTRVKICGITVARRTPAWRRPRRLGARA